MDEKRLSYQYELIVGKTLREKRIAKNMTLQQVGECLGTSRQAIFKYENAQNSMKTSIFKKYCYAIDEEPINVYEEISLKYMRYVDSHKNEIMKK